MRQNQNLKMVYQKILTILFFIFFTMPILSPAVFGITLYINFIIPFLDIGYLKYLIKLVTDPDKRRKVILYVSFLVLLVCFNQIKLIIEIIAITTNVIYLFYTKKKRLFKYLYMFIYINIFIAIVQFVFLYINPEVSLALGPTNVSKLIWGDYATATFTNFYTIFLIPRVSGWSREAGFFASLLILTFACYLQDSEEKKSWWKIILYIIGFIISFSKVTLIFIPLFLIIYLSKYINKVPFIIGILGVVFLGIIFSNVFLIKKYDNPGLESYTHRFSGYTVLQDLEFNELIFGVNEISQLQCREEYSFLQYIEGYKEFTGIPNLIIHTGVIISIAYILFLSASGISLSGFIFITITTLTTSYFTSQSFVILGYFYVYFYQKELGTKLFFWKKAFFKNLLNKK